MRTQNAATRVCRRVRAVDPAQGGIPEEDEAALGHRRHRRRMATPAQALDAMTEQDIAQRPVQLVDDAPAQAGPRWRSASSPGLAIAQSLVGHGEPGADPGTSGADRVRPRPRRREPCATSTRAPPPQRAGRDETPAHLHSRARRRSPTRAGSRSPEPQSAARTPRAGVTIAASTARARGSAPSCALNRRSTFSPLIGSSPSRASDDWPFPKSSIITATPNALRRSSVATAASSSRISADSVTSTTIASGGRSTRCSAAMNPAAKLDAPAAAPTR